MGKQKGRSVNTILVTRYSILDEHQASSIDGCQLSNLLWVSLNWFINRAIISGV